MRSQRGSIFTLKTHNRVMFFACIAAFALTAGVIYVPFLSSAFGLAEISLREFAVAMGLAVAVIPIVELVKLCQRRSARS